MIKEKHFHSILGWLCAGLVFALYCLIPIFEFFLSIEFKYYIVALFLFLSTLFLDEAKPVREACYRSFWRDGWLPTLGWICAFSFTWQILIYPILSSILSSLVFVERLPNYSGIEIFVLIVLMIRITLHQAFGKSLSNTLHALQSKFVIPDK